MKVWDENGNKKETNNDYIDLGLPSGTLWAYRDFYRTGNESKFKDYISRFYFRNLLPTKNQFRELGKFCNVKKYRNFYLFISKVNGNKLILFDGYYEPDNLFDFNKIVLDEVLENPPCKFYSRHFWCLRLVKKKNECS